MSHINSVEYFPTSDIIRGIGKFCYYPCANSFFIRLDDSDDFINIVLSNDFMIFKDRRIIFRTEVSVAKLAALCDDLKDEHKASIIVERLLKGISENTDIGKILFG